MTNKPTLDRRELLTGMLAVSALACTPGTGTKDADTDTDTVVDTDTDTVVDTDPIVPLAWATGGTAALAEAYDVDFGADLCSQTCELTLGPCYAQTMERRDISEGVDGLGTRMVLRVVDVDCNPVEGAVVDVWHTAPNGLYSGPDAAAMCTSNDSAATASRWFRGTQTTDADGRVDFDACLPGWYPGRAVHIHVQIRVGGDSYVISQLGYDEALLADVFDTHPAYEARGRADTSNVRDGILSRDLASYLFAWKQADDGALVVWKTLTIRGSLADPTC